MVSDKSKLIVSSEVIQSISERARRGLDHYHLLNLVVSGQISVFVEFGGVLLKSCSVGGRNIEQASIKPHGRQRITNAHDLCVVPSYQEETDRLELLLAGVNPGQPLMMSGHYFLQERGRFSRYVGIWELSEEGFFDVYKSTAGPLLKFSSAELMAPDDNKAKAELSLQIANRRELKEVPQIRRDEVSEAMQDIIKHRPDISVAEMWAKLREMKEQEVWPFRIGGAEGEIKYESSEGVKTISRKNVSDRLRRMKELAKAR